jgi:creatinine amidohydrolase/Fe(II)-dependent formamide hydrolase-like protein
MSPVARIPHALLWLCAVTVLPARAQEPRSLFLEDLTTAELKDAIAAGYQTVLVFSGSVEASGPHLALGKHNFRARDYAERVARDLGHTLVAPIVPVAPTSEQLLRFPGTINVRPEVFAQVNADIARSLAAAGFKNVVLLGDHGGDQEPLKALAPRLDRELSTKGTRVFFSGDGYARSTQEIEAYAKAHGMIGAGHGGLWDTAELWAVNPAAVRPDQFALGDTAGTVMSAAGVSGDPRPATVELGRRFGEIRVRNAVAEIRALLAAR